jgi:hypothetical protein
VIKVSNSGTLKHQPIPLTVQMKGSKIQKNKCQLHSSSKRARLTRNLRSVANLATLMKYGQEM